MSGAAEVTALRFFLRLTNLISPEIYGTCVNRDVVIPEQLSRAAKPRNRQPTLAVVDLEQAELCDIISNQLPAIYNTPLMTRQ